MFRRTRPSASSNYARTPAAPARQLIGPGADQSHGALDCISCTTPCLGAAARQAIRQTVRKLPNRPLAECGRAALSGSSARRLEHEIRTALALRRRGPVDQGSLGRFTRMLIVSVRAAGHRWCDPT